MELPLCRPLVNRLDIVASAGSTNADLVAAVAAHPDAWPHASVLATDNQVAGRGRLDRVWRTEPGTAVAVSVLVRPDALWSDTAFGWLPLIAGLAMVRAIGECGVVAEVKWPNDVFIEGKKVCGILCELVPGQRAVVIGSGVNLTQTTDQLPVDTATSLAAAGAERTDADAVISKYLAHLMDVIARVTKASGDVVAAGVNREIADACHTLGRAVRVLMPDGSVLTGRAADLDDHGRLIVEDNGRRTVVAAGDVTHLRY